MAEHKSENRIPSVRTDDTMTWLYMDVIIYVVAEDDSDDKGTRLDVM